MEMTETLLHIVLWSVLLFGFGGVFSGMMRASGDVLIPMLLSLGTILIVEVPLALYLSTHVARAQRHLVGLCDELHDHAGRCRRATTGSSGGTSRSRS